MNKKEKREHERYPLMAKRVKEEEAGRGDLPCRP